MPLAPSVDCAGLLPDGRRVSFAFPWKLYGSMGQTSGQGINYKVDVEPDLHAAYTLVWLGDMDVEQTKSRSGGTLSGTYRNSTLHIIGGGAT